jgi:hypothetical protein
MTPDEYLDQIRDLVAHSQHAEALAFADDKAAAVSPPLSAFQVIGLGDTLHLAAMAVGIEEYAARKHEIDPADVA